MTAMDIIIHTTFLPHDDPDASLAFYRDTLGFEVRNDVGYGGMRRITVGPADQPGGSSPSDLAERKPAMKDTQKSPKSTAIDKTSEGWTDEERAAMKERHQELKASARRAPRADKADGESAVLAKIAALPQPDRAMGERLHAIIKASAPALTPKTWYGMPAYADKDGKVVCFFRGAEKFKERYMTLGFNQEANLDDGAMWPIAFALKELTAVEEARIGALVKKAVS